MDTALIVITLLSIGLTGALLVYAARLQREQREREDARVAALAEELLLEQDDCPPALRVFAKFDRSVPHGPAPNEVPERGASSGARPADAPSGPSPFGSYDASAPAAYRVAVAVGAMVVVLVVGGVYAASARGRGTFAAEARGTGTAAALELVALDQAKAGEVLTVRGVVRNPAGAERRRGLAAMVFVFDRSGAVVASARAPIDAQVFEAGDESPFTVAVPRAADGTRYRVSFRADREVLPHVDRRTASRAVRIEP